MLLWLVVLAVPASSARAEGPHCWCRINKNDCGDGNTACQLYDFGAVAQFGTFQTGKEDLCKDKLASMTEPEGAQGRGGTSLRAPEVDQLTA